MSGFDPGPGWREASPNDATAGTEHVIYSDGERDHYWVREEPLPPLPTEPYTVIRVEWKDGQPAKEYALIGGRWGVMRPDELAKQMAGFEVLAEPRAVTAGAFRNRVREVYNDIQDGRTLNETLAIVADEFGADA